MAAVLFALHRALGLALAVVAVTRDHGPKRPRARAEIRPTGVVLEADELSVRGVRQQVADKALFASAGGDIENADARDRRPDLGDVLVPEKLVAAADRENGSPALDRLSECRAVLLRQVRPHEVLPLVLADSEVPHILPLRVDALGD